MDVNEVLMERIAMALEEQNETLNKIKHNLEYIGSNLEQIFYVLRDGKEVESDGRRDTNHH